jgi:ribosomal protein S18 acetylase RimI-like enzyme
VERGGEDGIYYLEKLSVLPGRRHEGLGRALLDFALAIVKDMGGDRVSIGMMEENRVLKKWYEENGFRETAVRKFDHLPFAVCFMEKIIRGGNRP